MSEANEGVGASRRPGRATRSAWGVALAIALMAPSAAAQELDGRALFPYPNRPDAVQSVVVTARPRAPVRGDVTLRINTTWPNGQTRLQRAVSLGAGGPHTVVIPAPLGSYDSVELSLDELGANGSVIFGDSGSATIAAPTYIAVVGLGGRVTAAVQALNPTGPQAQARIVTATGLSDVVTGDAILPTVASAYSGTHALIASAAAILAAPPEARRALSEWVLAGGFLAVSPRAASDLRDPFFVALLGRVVDDGDGRVSGPRLLARRWGAAAHTGLGVAGVIPFDLSPEEWFRDARADAALRDFVDFADGAGGGLVAPGDLALYRRFTRPGDDEVSRAFRPRADMRGLLIPVTALLALYVIGVGVALARNRRDRRPLRVFVRLPLAALGVLAVIVGGARLTRSSASTARVLAVYDVGDGSTRAVERVFAGLSAGSARTFEIAAPDDGIALYATPASGSSTLRWSGRALSVERVRLGLWETGLAYTERLADAGGGIRLERDGAVARVVNRSPWHLDAIALVRDGGVVARFGAAAPGTTVMATVAQARASASFDAMFPDSRDALARAFTQQMMGAPSKARSAWQLFALARAPAEVLGRVQALGFAPVERSALVRVVIPVVESDPGRVGSYSARLDVRRNDDAPDDEPVPRSARVDAAVADDAVEGGAP